MGAQECIPGLGVEGMGWRKGDMALRTSKVSLLVGGPGGQSHTAGHRPPPPLLPPAVAHEPALSVVALSACAVPPLRCHPRVIRVLEVSSNRV